MSLYANAYVLNRWFRDRAWFAHPAHAGRTTRIRSLFRDELVKLDHQTYEIPPRDVVALKCIRKTANGMEQQAIIAGDRRLAIEFSSESLARSAWDLLTCGDANIDDVFALAHARESGRLR
jgi:hypothetical protein